MQDARPTIATLDKDVLSVICLSLGPRDAVTLVCSFRAARALTNNGMLWTSLAAKNGFKVDVTTWRDFVTQTKRGIVCSSCLCVFPGPAKTCVHHEHTAVVFLNTPPTFSPHYQWGCCGNEASSWWSDGCVGEGAHTWKLAATLHPLLTADEFGTSYGVLGEEACYDCERQPCTCRK